MLRPKIQELWTSATIDRLFDCSGIGFFIVSPDRHLLDANRTFCEQMGYSRDELLQKTIMDLTHPGDVAMTRGVFQRGVSSDSTQVFDKRYVKKNGSTLWVRLRSSAVKDAEGSVSCRIVMVEDITEQKENELFLEQMAAIVETSDDAIFRASTRGIIQFWSKGAERLYGYRAEEVMGKSAGFIAAEPNSPRVINVVEKLLRGEVITDPFGVALHKEGHLLYVSVLLFPLKNKDGEVISFAAVHRDVSELKRLEEQLRHAQRMETAGLLAGGIAHDFNNILTVIQGSTSALAQEIPAGARSLRYLDLVARSADKASRLTRQLLAFSRKQKIAPQLLDPSALLAEFVGMLQRTLGGHIALDTRFASHWMVREDPTQLEQIALNLGVNARHSMPDGGCLVLATRDFDYTGGEIAAVQPGLLRYTPVPLRPGQYVEIAISDTGCGMEEEVLKQIFEPFYTTRAKGEGTGLGLAVVYGIVSESGGGIEVSTLRGQGSTFRIWLRRVEGTPLQQPLPQKTPLTTGKGVILVIEDDDDVRALIVEMLSDAGYTPCEAATPRQIVEHGLPMPVDLILSDMIMPDMSGPDFAKYWLGRYPATKFLFMSGYFDEKKYPEQFNQDNMLLKPFKPVELVARVARQLKQ